MDNGGCFIAPKRTFAHVVALVNHYKGRLGRFINLHLVHVDHNGTKYTIICIVLLKTNGILPTYNVDIVCTCLL